jgi:hypothetical protein
VAYRTLPGSASAPNVFCLVLRLFPPASTPAHLEPINVPTSGYVPHVPSRSQAPTPPETSREGDHTDSCHVLLRGLTLEYSSRFWLVHLRDFFKKVSDPGYSVRPSIGIGGVAIFFCIRSPADYAAR